MGRGQLNPPESVLWPESPETCSQGPPPAPRRPSFSLLSGSFSLTGDKSEPLPASASRVWSLQAPSRLQGC